MWAWRWKLPVKCRYFWLFCLEVSEIEQDIKDTSPNWVRTVLKDERISSGSYTIIHSHRLKNLIYVVFFGSPKTVGGDGLSQPASRAALPRAYRFYCSVQQNSIISKAKQKQALKKQFHHFLPISGLVNQESIPKLFLPLKTKQGKNPQKSTWKAFSLNSVTN